MSDQIHDKLTLQQQHIGRSRYLWFTRMNAVSFACLADSILILYALKNGANEFVIGLLSSFFYLTMPFMFVGKAFVKRIGAARTYGLVWVLRKMCASLLLLVPLVIRTWGTHAGLGLLVFSIFGFFSFRSMGITANTPILGEITDQKSRGQYLASNWMYFHIMLLITVGSLIFVLNYNESIPVFQGIITFGIIFGLLAASIISRVPETNGPKLSAHKSIREAFFRTIHTPRIRKLLFAWTASGAAIVLIGPFSIVALKRGYLISDRNALFFTLVQVVGSITVSYINRIILDRFGPRPMLVIFNAGFVAICALWIVAPAQLIVVYPAVIFLIFGACRSGNETSLTHYFLTITTDGDRVGVNIFMYMISGVLAGFIGTFMGGGLLQGLRYVGFADLNIYRLYFAIIFVVCLPIIFLTRRLEPVDDWRIRDTLSALFAFRDIRALFTLQRIENQAETENGERSKQSG
ncbi:MFS transporter [candidate division KSB1 bacterium]|nr:MFS transporter [candidate division KSB1 bacterium]